MGYYSLFCVGESFLWCAALLDVWDVLTLLTLAVGVVLSCPPSVPGNCGLVCLILPLIFQGLLCAGGAKLRSGVLHLGGPSGDPLLLQ